MFDGFEVNKVIGLDAKGNPVEWRKAVASEPCFDSGKVERGLCVRWSLYGHRPEGGVECIADFERRSDAYAVLALLTGPGCKPAGRTR